MLKDRAIVMADNVQILLMDSEKAFSFRAKQASRLRTAVLALLVVVVSYVAAWLGHSIALSSQGVSVLWPANALLVSVLLLVPRRTWPILIPAGLAGLVAHDLQFGFTPWIITQLIVADTIEILIVCLGLGYCFDGIPRLNSSKALAKYCLFAVVLAPFVSSFLVAIAVPGRYLLNWRIWFFSQTLAFLTLTPAILSWAIPDYRFRFRESHKLKVEGAALLGGLFVLGYFVLLPSWKTMPSALLYAFVPFLLWAALRFGSMGVSTSMIVISFMSIWGAIHGEGPFEGPGPFQEVLAMQLFLLFAAIPFMILAAMAEERERHQKVLSSVSTRLIEAQEKERVRIARELHDDINQRLALVSVALSRLKMNSPVSQEIAENHVEQVQRDVLEIGKDVQALSHRLHSSKLEYLGLAAAAGGFCKEFSTQNNVEIDFRCENISRNVPSEISLCVFRVLQEAVQNASKYSGTRRFAASLEGTPKEIYLAVHDSGIGFNPESVTNGHGLGLISMRERMKLVDGQLSIVSTPEHGTTVHARVPLHRG